MFERGDPIFRATEDATRAATSEARSVLRSVVDFFRHLVALPRNLRRLNDMAETLDEGRLMQRFERVARVLENQTNTQRNVTDAVHALERAVIESSKQRAIAAEEMRELGIGA